MKQSGRTSYKILASGSSLRRRVAVSLALVRIILVPVIFLAVFYLVRLGSIVDRIVSLDAPLARLAEQASVTMLEARRSERNYFLLHDAGYLNANAESLARLKGLLGRIRDLDTSDNATALEALKDVDVYQQQFAAAVSLSDRPEVPFRHVQGVVRAYEMRLSGLLRQAPHEPRVQLVEALHGWADSFDADVSKAVESGDPTLREVTADLQASSGKVLRVSSDLETVSWSHIQQDHEQAQKIAGRATWLLSVVSALTLVLSVWISFVLPRRVVKPLTDLKNAVDHAAAGNYEIEFDVQGEGEVVDLANSVRSLIVHLRQRESGHAQS